MESGALHAIDSNIKAVGQADALQDGRRALAGGHDRRAKPMRSNRSQKTHRIVIHLDAVLFQMRLKIAVLLIAESVERFTVRAILGAAVRQDDAAGVKEAFHSVMPELAVHVPAIISIDIEWLKRPVLAGGSGF